MIIYHRLRRADIAARYFNRKRNTNQIGWICIDICSDGDLGMHRSLSKPRYRNLQRWPHQITLIINDPLQGEQSNRFNTLCYRDLSPELCDILRVYC